MAQQPIVQRPYPALGIGWLLAIIALIIGILIAIGSVTLSAASVGGEAILLALAILL